MRLEHYLVELVLLAGIICLVAWPILSGWLQ